MNKKSGSFSIAKKAYAKANSESHSTDHDPTKYRPVISSIINDPSYNKGMRVCTYFAFLLVRLVLQ